MKALLLSWKAAPARLDLRWRQPPRRLAFNLRTDLRIPLLQASLADDRGLLVDDNGSLYGDPA